MLPSLLIPLLSPSLPLLQFLVQDALVSRITRKSINLLKQHFKDDMTKDDWRLVIKLKQVFKID